MSTWRCDIHPSPSGSVYDFCLDRVCSVCFRLMFWADVVQAGLSKGKIVYEV